MAKAWLAILFCACAAGQSVDGTVVNSVTNAGIGGLKLDLVQGSTAVSISTDSFGKFHAENLKEGSWTVRWQLPEYTGRPARFTIANGTPAKVELKLTPKPRVSGHVVDGNGHPVPKASIILISKSSMYAYPTDDSGAFDLSESLVPADYVVSVTPPSGMRPPDPEPDSGRALGWARTYYPGSVLPEGAATIPLHAGVEIRDLEVKLMTVPAHTIHGVLLQPDGSPAPKVKVTLGQGRPFPTAQMVESAEDGSFQFTNVIDEEWNISAVSSDLQASQWIEMSGRDMERLTLRLSPPFTVTGRVVLETPQGFPAPRVPAMHIHSHVPRTTLEMALGGPGVAAKMEADGGFTIEKTYSGSYSIQPGNAVPPYYLDSIRVNGAEMSTLETDLTPGASISVTYKMNGGTVRGTLEGCTEGSVWLVPQELARRYNYFRFAPCLEQGHYEFKAVRPGEYYALPVIDDLPRPWLFGVFEQVLLDRATKVTVRAGETTAVDLRPY